MTKYISKLLESDDSKIIHPYAGYANHENVYAQARVLVDKGINESRDDSIIKNLIHSFRRFESDEVRHAQVEVRIGAKTEILHSDHEGYITLDTTHGLMLHRHETTWIPIEYILMHEEKQVFEITSSVMKPSMDAEYGVISDIDDTILHTGVSSTLKWRVFVNSILKNSHQRTPLEGAEDFYELLEDGKYGIHKNPFFYISNSPWNIYNYLQSFMRNNQFPKGPLLLRDIGLGNPKPDSFLEGNKYRKIQHILRTYPELSFILIGDAAEIDTDIYLNIASEFPERIKCIYIRAVYKRSKLSRIRRLLENEAHIETVLMKDSEEGIQHARSVGFIA